MLPGISMIPFTGETVTAGSQQFATAGLSAFVVPNFNFMTVEIWGGGGAGGYCFNGNTISQGGQGGSYVKYTILAGQLSVGSAQSVYVGAGAASAAIYGAPAGNPGMYSYFADAIWAIGGYGGRGQAEYLRPAAIYTPTVSVPWTLILSETGGAGGYASAGGSTTYAGAGGGGGQNTAYVTQPGGTSIYGGNGGQGGSNSASTTSGTAPGGGGGGTNGGNASTNGAGGTGKIIINWT